MVTAGPPIQITGLTGAHYRPPDGDRCPACGSMRPEVHMKVPVVKAGPDPEQRQGYSPIEVGPCEDDWHPWTWAEVEAMHRWVEHTRNGCVREHRALPGTSYGALEFARAMLVGGVRAQVEVSDEVEGGVPDEG